MDQPGDPCGLPGDTLGTPGVQGRKIDDSGCQFERIFDLRRSKSVSKSTLRASQKLIPSYFVELDEPDRLRQVPKLENHLK